VRIISGSHKGKTIFPGKYFNSRPTTDTAKEGLFNILNNYFDFETIGILDLFSGTGCISYEFASRGCTNITSVELSYKNAEFIKTTAKELKFEGFKSIKGNAFQFLKNSLVSYDIIFADPPYDMADIETIPDFVFQNNRLSENGWLIIEHSSKNNFSSHPNFHEKRNYGKVNFSIFKNIVNN